MLKSHMLHAYNPLIKLRRALYSYTEMLKLCKSKSIETVYNTTNRKCPQLCCNDGILINATAVGPIQSFT